MKKAHWLILLILFFLSGASGLIYEILWVRMFSLVFGNTNYAATIVLSAFFTGMALGSLYFGRKARDFSKPFRFYGLLELGIGLSALLVPFLIAMMDGFYPSLYRALGENNPLFFVLRFALSFAIVVIPTFLMGGTFPLLVKFTALLRQGFGKSVSLLYALNTFGGVTGAFLSGFFLVRYLGIYPTILTAVVLNVVVGAAAVILSRRFLPLETLSLPRGSDATQEQDPSASALTHGNAFLVISFITGLLSVAFQVVWARLLVYILSSSVYAFSIMLTTFLFGIALGSLIAARLIRRIKGITALSGIILGITGVYGVLTIPLMVFLAEKDEAIMRVFGFSSWTQYNGGRFFQSAIIILLPTIFMGIIFPLIARIAKTAGKAESTVIGNIYFANTAGAVFGSVIAGFLLVPIVGCKGSILLLSFSYLMVALTILFSAWSGMKARLCLICVTMAIMVVSPIMVRGNPFVPLFNIREKGSAITYLREGSTGTVTVHRYPSHKVINVNRVNVAGTSFVLRTTQKLQAFLPLLARKDPALVCQIGFGSGETSSIVSRYEGVQRLDVVDISHEVFDAAPEFKEINHGLYNASNVRKIVMDGKNYMHLTHETYDLIMNDSIHPVECGNASLYTREYFEDCKRHLRDGGVMSSWFPLFALESRDFKSLIRTFNTVFPGCTLWVGNNCVNRHALLIGRKDGQPVTVDYDFLRTALLREWIKKEFAEIRMYDVYDVLDSFMLNGQAINEFVAGADINTDFFPILEYRSPVTLASDAALLAGNISDMLRMRSNVFYSLANITTEDPDQVKASLDRFMESTAYIYRGHINSILENYREVVPHYLKAAEINPDDHDGKNLVGDLIATERDLSAKIEKPDATNKELQDAAVVTLELGRPDRAKEIFESLLKREPDHRASLYWLFDIYQNLGDRKRQEEIIDRLMILENNPEVFFQKGLLRGQQGDFNASITFFQKAISLKSQDPKNYFYLGLGLESLGDNAPSRELQWDYYATALKNYEKARLLDKENEFPVTENITSLQEKLRFTP